ncbi:serine/threonine-protein kinase D3 [Culex quinquefasciatus]|uniref:Serine/threonine-protein kinase D3 n=1 Tax=Culex quinquefasciatus TaxID=7176 RepID=B0WHS8_CULQU|nr:serine/threonine-protein kinase D3 [Culex quinquefasciatus]|eukprot:XP_001848262.1 serine/threonine-protein kinase D3 [Culex quinquefasciatus]
MWFLTSATRARWATPPLGQCDIRQNRSPSLGSSRTMGGGSIKIPHSFSIHTYTRPTVCQYCKKLLRGLFKQGVQCRDCHYNAHKKCVELVPKDCTGENTQPVDPHGTGGEPVMAYKEDPGDESDLDEGGGGGAFCGNNNSSSHHNRNVNLLDLGGGPPPVKINGMISPMHHDGVDCGIAWRSSAKQSRQSSNSSSSPSANIPLMRIVQSVKHTKRRGGRAIKEGWLVHFTNKEKTLKRHYWRLDSKGHHAGSKYYREIPLNEILTVDPARNLQSEVLHCFEIRTANVDYFVGQDPLYNLKEGDPMLALPPPDSGIGAYLAKSWETAIKQALMPVTSGTRTESASSEPEEKVTDMSQLYQIYPDEVLGSGQFGIVYGGNHRKTTRRRGDQAPEVLRNKGYNRSLDMWSVGVIIYPERDVPVNEDEDINDQIQNAAFMYPPNPWKEISSDGEIRCFFNSESLIMNILEIISAIDLINNLLQVKQRKRFTVDKSLLHCWLQDLQTWNDLRILEAQVGLRYLTHESDDARWGASTTTTNTTSATLVAGAHQPTLSTTEEAAGEAVGNCSSNNTSSGSNQASPKLNDFRGKAYKWILVALKYLHSRNIVHCDLKPENVLLSSDAEFPQVKLCDFGFARIIGEKSFRRSVVGTPAYLAPEVLRNKGYNRSLDMWSVGVIIYVSLSGTFPFNEDEDINDQIQNAAFMYPPNPWKEISSDAIDLINNLLQVKQRKRFTVDKSLLHCWLQDLQTWNDLRILEAQVGLRYLTHESDDARWGASTTTTTTTSATLVAGAHQPTLSTTEEAAGEAVGNCSSNNTSSGSNQASPKLNDFRGKAYKWVRGRLCRLIKA